jgi:lipopolysaccharide biosynthesis glycosyltransferase
MPADADYFNAGVLLFNLRYWRQHGVKDRLIKYVEQNHAKLKFHDQDAINGSMHSLIRPLPRKWNASHTFYLEPVTRLGGITLRQLHALRTNPSIVHFTGPSKPWRKDEYHPFQRAWMEVLKRTPFAEQYAAKASAAQFSARYAKRFGRPVKRFLRASLHIASTVIRGNA